MIVVEPTTFELVAFDAEGIATAAGELAGLLGCGDLTVTFVIDERTPMTRCWLVSVEPMVIAIEAGAIEDPRRIRHVDPARLREVIAHQLLGALDRRVRGYGAAIADDELSLAVRSAWDAHIAGRLHRLGLPVTRERWEHRFHLGHRRGPEAASAFATLWGTEVLSWDELEATSLSARADPCEPVRLVR